MPRRHAQGPRRGPRAVLAFQKQQTEQASKLQAQVAEGTEIEQRIKKIDVRLYAAVGMLRPSTLQVGNGPAALRRSSIV